MTDKSKWIDRVRDRVMQAADAERMVNVPLIARELAAAHPEVPFIEIEQTVLGFADLSGVGIVFDGGQQSSVRSSGIVVEFVDEDGAEINDKTPDAFVYKDRDTSPGDTG